MSKQRHRFPGLHRALDYAAEAHSGQLRKATDIPYLAHLIGVCALVLEYGGDEEQAIAGLLHDVVEDCGEQHRQAVRAIFGARVADIVDGCTDGVPDATGEKEPWQGRKEKYLRHLDQAAHDTLLVSACDKLYNARAIAADVRAIGRDVFHRFSVPRDKTLWYYKGLLDVFTRRLRDQPGLILELQVAIAAMAQ